MLMSMACSVTLSRRYTSTPCLSRFRSGRTRLPALINCGADLMNSILSYPPTPARIIALALHFLQPSYSSGNKGSQVQLPELSPSAHLAGRALQKVLSEIQVRQLRVRRPLGLQASTGTSDQ